MDLRIPFGGTLAKREERFETLTSRLYRNYAIFVTKTHLLADFVVIGEPNEEKHRHRHHCASEGNLQQLISRVCNNAHAVVDSLPTVVDAKLGNFLMAGAVNPTTP